MSAGQHCEPDGPTPPGTLTGDDHSQSEWGDCGDKESGPEEGLGEML